MKNDIKRGIKQAEMDKIKYHVKVFFSIIIGMAVWAIFQNIWVGVGTLLVLGIISANQYYETNERS